MSRPLTIKDLWLAIFSLDAYQRGYELQVSTAKRSDTHLGNALVGRGNEVFVGGEGRGLFSVQGEGVGGALNAVLSLPARQYAGCE